MDDAPYLDGLQVIFVFICLTPLVGRLLLIVTVAKLLLTLAPDLPFRWRCADVHVFEAEARINTQTHTTCNRYI